MSGGLGPLGPVAGWSDQTGRVALVTGAARGIGAATARRLGELGARVALCDRLGEDLGRVEAELSAAGVEVQTSVLDVRDAAAAGDWVDGAASRWGRVDILVNNAGGGFWAPFTAVSSKGRSALIEENFVQVADLIGRVVPVMAPGGSIVNITSIEAHRAGPGFAVYSAMKAAVENLTRSLALELAPDIRVNAVAPDMIPTPGDEELQGASGALSTPGVAPDPLGMMGHPDDCAAAVVFLCSQGARFVTGTTLHVDGGNGAALGWRRRESDGAWVL